MQNATSLINDLVAFYRRMAERLEKKIREKLLKEIQTALEANGYNIDEVEFGCTGPLEWSTDRDTNDKGKDFFTKRDAQCKNIRDMAKSYPKMSNWDQGLINDFASYVQGMDKIEYDVIAYAYFRKNPTQALDIEIELERKILLRLPFVFVMEVTLTGSKLTLQKKIKQLKRQIVFMVMLLQFFRSKFTDQTVCNLIRDRKINIYAFLGVNGLLKDQHKDFNELYKADTFNFWNRLSFKNMIRRVSTSCIGQPKHMYQNERIAKGFFMDLLHFDNDSAVNSLRIDVDTFVKDLKDQICKVKEEVENQVKELGKKVGNLESKIGQLTITVNGFMDIVERLEKKIEGHEGVVAGLEKKIADLGCVIEGLQENIANFEGTVKKLDEQKGHNGNVEGLEAKVGGLEAKVVGLEGSLKTLEKSIKSESAMKTLEDKIDGLQSQLKPRRFSFAINLLSQSAMMVALACIVKYLQNN